MSKTAFILPDQHYEPEGGTAGGVDPRAESVALQAIRIVKPDIFINLGDVCEFDSISHWRYKRVKRPPLEYQLPLLERELEAGNAGLDRFDKALDKVGCNERWYLGGNHCWTWLENFVEEHPYIAEKYHPIPAFKMKARGYGVKPYGERLKIGQMHYYHGGLIGGSNIAKAHAMQWGANVMFGHHHSIESARVPHIDGTHGGWSVGCICKLDKQFLKHKPTGWAHAVTLVHYNDDGSFVVEICEIWEGRAWIYGREVVAKC